MKKYYCIVSFDPFVYISAMNSNALMSDYEYITTDPEALGSSVVITDFLEYNQLTPSEFLRQLDHCKGENRAINVYTLTVDGIKEALYMEPIYVYSSEIQWDLPTYCPSVDQIKKAFSVSRDEFVNSVSTMSLLHMEHRLEEGTGFPDSVAGLTTDPSQIVTTDTLGYLCIPITARQISLSSKEDPNESEAVQGNKN